jgi:hypothetical protein
MRPLCTQAWEDLLEEGAGEGPASVGTAPGGGGCWRAVCLRGGVEALLGELPPRTATALRMHYGLGGARPRSHSEARTLHFTDSAQAK